MQSGKTIIVRPVDQVTTANTKELLFNSSVKPSDLGIGINKLIGIFDGGVVLEVTGENTVTSLLSKLDADPNLKGRPVKRWPKVILFNIPEVIKDEVIKEDDLLSQNSSHGGSVANLVHKYNIKAENGLHRVFEIKSSLFKLLLRQGYVSLG